jgi:hypothetical protein
MAERKQKLPKYRRVGNPPPMRLTKRDKKILETIHAFDGMLGFPQIKKLFFTGTSQAKERMKLLYQHRYVNRPNRDERRRVPEMIYWLDKRGAEIVAAMNSVSLKELRWVKTPRWFQVEHDLAVNDFRIMVVEACDRNDDITLSEWIPEREFRSFPDKISYTYQDRHLKRNIIPDGYFMLSTPNLHIRYLIEIDRSTEDNPRFFREKIAPGLAYIRSSAFEKRFGYRRGRWLVVTTSEKRMKNMLRQARRAKTKGLFYFTIYDKLNVSTFLFEPIWRREDREELVPLLFLE